MPRAINQRAVVARLERNGYAGNRVSRSHGFSSPAIGQHQNRLWVRTLLPLIAASRFQNSVSFSGSICGVYIPVRCRTTASTVPRPIGVMIAGRGAGGSGATVLPPQGPAAPPYKRPDHDERQTDDVLDTAQIDIPAMMTAVAQIRNCQSHGAEATEHRQGDTEHHYGQTAPALPAGSEEGLRVRRRISHLLVRPARVDSYSPR